MTRESMFEERQQKYKNIAYNQYTPTEATLSQTVIAPHTLHLEKVEK